MSSLQFYWLESKPEESVASLWGQLVGGLHRLQFVLDEINELRTAPAKHNLENTIGRLEYHLLNYLARVYELRERITGLAAKVCGQPRLHSRLKSRTQKEKALEEIAEQYPSLSAHIRDIFNLTETDIELRNQHTHENFLRLGLLIDGDVRDPLDALLDRTAKEDSRRHLEHLLWGEVAALSKMYYEKGEKIIGLSYKVLEYCDPHLCQGQF